MVQKALIKEKGNLRLTGISSAKILSLLCEKHSQDVIIPECKNGETWGARDLLKMDAWVLKRSYSPLTTIVYEIKTSRQDFEQDQKWTRYLDLCHQFYFVCPAGLIRATDVPSQVGIIWATKDKLYTKRRAERVEPDNEKLMGLLIYVLMSRSHIVANMYEVDGVAPVDKLQLVREEVERANERKGLAYFVRGHVREVFERVQQQEREMGDREDSVKRFEVQLAQLGITWDSEHSEWQDTMRVTNEIHLLKKVLDEWTLSKIGRLGASLNEFVEMIKKYRADAPGKH